VEVEFINFNGDESLNPEIKKIPLSNDSQAKPPAYCLPWVEASRYSIQIRSNAHYIIEKGKDKVEAWIEEEGKKFPYRELWIKIPKDMGLDDSQESMERVRLSRTPSYSSPWQEKRVHSVTLKMGIGWWTKPGWGMFFGSAIHRNEDFRIVEGMVRTDLWHKDVPIVVMPLKDRVVIPKHSVIASAWLIPAEDIQLVHAKKDGQKLRQLIKQILMKGLEPSYYKEIAGIKKKQPS